MQLKKLSEKNKLEKITLKEIVEACKGLLVGEGMCGSVSSISTDSRSLKKGELFIPLCGENFDGHKFIDEAAKKGICGFLFSDELAFASDLIGKKTLFAVKVKDTTKALQDIAAYYRRKYDIKMICVTGSNGKTTTKDILGTVMSSSENTLVTEGNKNNHIGVPLMLLRLKENIKNAVLELGMNHKGEIDRLSKLTRPDIAVITNVGYAHMEFFKSLDEVAKAKAEIKNHLDKKSPLVVNGDDKVLMNELKSYKGRLVKFGTKGTNNYIAKDIDAEKGALEFVIKDKADKKEYAVKTNLMGRHNVYNLLAAYAAAKEAGKSANEIIASFAEIKISDNRMRLKDFKGITFINDAYNANPTSAKAAVEAFSALKCKGRKIFVFGDMKELGKISKSAHQEVAEAVLKNGIDVLVTLGASTKEAVKDLSTKGNVFSFETHKDAAFFIIGMIEAGDAILFKGSRAMKLELIEKFLFDLMTEKKTQNEGALV